MNTISIYHINGNIFQEIEYNDFDNLSHQLKLLIIYHDSDLFITLLINDEILNNFDIIDMTILSKLNDYNTITLVFNQKKELYCLNNINGKYILAWKIDNYYHLLNIIIEFYEYDSYNIIMNNSYKNLILKAVKKNGKTLDFISIYLQNNKEFILECIKQNGYALKYAKYFLQNDKDIVLAAVKQNGRALEYTNINFQNNREIVSIAVMQNGNALKFTNFQNDKDIVLKSVKQNGFSLKFANIDLQNDKEVILEAVKQNKHALQFTNTNNTLKNDKDVLLCINKNR